jgi:hypothetical protein
VSEPLRGPLTMGGSQLEAVALQRRKAKAVMNPPLAPRRARLPDHGRVQHPHRSPLSAGCRVTPFSCHNCWHKCRSQASASRNRFSNVTSETSAMPANLACTAVSRSDHPPPTCSNSECSNASIEAKPRNRFTAPMLRPYCSQPEGSRWTRTGQSSRPDMHRSLHPNYTPIKFYLSAYGLHPPPPRASMGVSRYPWQALRQLLTATPVCDTILRTDSSR